MKTFGELVYQHHLEIFKIENMKLLLTSLILIILLGCQKEESFRIECATLDQGWVELTNSTGINLLMDITWDDIKENEPILLNVLDFGGAPMSTVFDHIPQGIVKVWYSPNNGDNWFWKQIEVTTCDKTYCIINIEDIISLN